MGVTFRIIGTPWPPKPQIATSSLGKCSLVYYFTTNRSTHLVLIQSELLHTSTRESLRKQTAWASNRNVL